MSLYGRFFKPDEKTILRKIQDRVAVMTSLECKAYVKSSWDALKELHKTKNNKGTLVYDRSENKNIEADHKPYIEYINKIISREGKSTEDDAQAWNDLRPIRDIIVEDIYATYTVNGYGNHNYNDIKVMNILLNNTSKDITIWPHLKWASSWNPKTQQYEKLYNKLLKKGA